MMAVRAVVNYQKLGALILAAVVLYNEYLAYYSAFSQWPDLPQATTTTTHILLVADPQIQGLQDEPAFPLGSVTRWDSDRYLAKTFGWALYYYRPDVIVFLGDLVDEGSRTTSRDLYLDYVYRFHSIYPSHSAGLMIYVGGDNDLGGEGEPVTKEKIDQFREFFPHRTVNKLKGTASSSSDIVALNVLSQQAPNLTAEIPEMSSSEDGGDGKRKHFRIGVAHIPVLPPFDG